MHTFLVLILVAFEVAILAWLVFRFCSDFISAYSGAPYVPMVRYRLAKLLAFGEVKARDIFYDLGSGDGRVLIRAVKEFQVTRAIGYEVSPWPYYKSRWAIRRSGFKNIKVIRKNIFEADFRDATCVYIYLFPKIVDRLAEKLAKELKPGTRIVCPSFPIDTIKHPQFQLKKSEKISSITTYLYERI